MIIIRLRMIFRRIVYGLKWSFVMLPFTLTKNTSIPKAIKTDEVRNALM